MNLFSVVAWNLTTQAGSQVGTCTVDGNLHCYTYNIFSNFIAFSFHENNPNLTSWVKIPEHKPIRMYVK